MKKKVPLGVSDFKELIEKGYYFVDKSLFIKEFIENSAKVILIPRPRRFGKTLNMSMIKYFFQKSQEDNSKLYENLAISRQLDIIKLQGVFPTIYLTFKDVKFSNWEDCLQKLRSVISSLYIEHMPAFNVDTFLDIERKYIDDMINMRGNIVNLSEALGRLSKFLYKHFNEKVIILIDEYDIPIQEGYLNGYYKEVVEFMRNFLSSALKDNFYLEKSLLTGILRVAKESIFSRLNNMDVSTLTSEGYSDKFGFTEAEVESLAKSYGIEEELESIRNWYNGYKFGNTTIYNPWSIVNYLDKPYNGFLPYWVNTSSNDLIKRLLGNSGKDAKSDLENLIKGETIYKNINENIVMDEVEKSSDNLWSFLLFSGYLKYLDMERLNGRVWCNLSIPNSEVKFLYEEIIINWFNEGIGKDKFIEMLQALKHGDIEAFAEIFTECVEVTFSFMDLGEESEKFYHAFVLGILVSLRNEYEIRSNRESGYGRYDVMLIPKNRSKKAVIFEFKRVSTFSGETLETAADKALKQIRERCYKTELLDKGIEDIIELGIAFEGKKVLVKKGDFELHKLLDEGIDAMKEKRVRPLSEILDDIEKSHK